jgi:uncharacterized protein YodC (DUF2158 family)
MAAKFSKGDVVKLAVPAPQGPVLAFRMTEDGVIECLVEWVDADGVTQQRWFDEDQLTGA